jgi:hypothetical protein
MIKLYVQRIILGKTNFNQVPTKLKAQVAHILIEEHALFELVPIEFGGLME